MAAAAPVTEVVEFDLPPSADLTTALPAACKTLTEQPGCRGARYSRHHEDAAKLTLFIDWDSIGAHEAFAANADVFGPFYASLAPLATTAPAPYHVAFDPPGAATAGAGGVLAVAPATEVLHLHFPADYGLEREQAALATLGEFAAVTQKAVADMGEEALLVGTPAMGWAAEEREWQGEKVRVLVAMLGWASVEAHLKYRDTDAFRGSIGMVRGLEGLKGIRVYHVACAKAA